MKTYKVLETHLGDRPDRPYKPGETRTLEPGAAKLLVDLKIIEPVDGDTDASADSGGRTLTAEEIEAFKASFKQVADERDTAEAKLIESEALALDRGNEIDRLKSDLEIANAKADAAEVERAAAHTEIDSTRQQLQAAEAERDTARAEADAETTKLAEAQAELDRLKASSETTAKSSTRK